MTGLYIFLGVIVLIVLYMISKYNGIIRLRNNTDQSFADIEVQMKQRFDLVPQLIATVKGYAKHEKELLEKLTNSRTDFLKAQNVDQKVEAGNDFSSALKSIFAVSENYPDLKANQNFMQLQTELSDLENKIAAARRFFNNSITEYNSYIQMFPASIVAGMFHFGDRKLFENEANEDVKSTPKIDF